MRLREALLRAFRARRDDRVSLDEADRLVAGGRAGPADRPLDHLLDAVRAPATAEELNGERALVAALAAERRHAMASGEPAVSTVAARRPIRTIIVAVVTAVALLGVGGAAVAARTGHLPDGFQQDAHRLFSELGIPAPHTSPTGAGPAPSPSRTRSPTPAPSRSTADSTPTPLPTASVTDGPAPGTRARWCTAWQTAAAGGRPMNGRDRRDLFAAAGGAGNVGDYCATFAASPSPSASPSTSTEPASPSADVRSKKPKKPKKPRPTNTPQQAPSGRAG